MYHQPDTHHPHTAKPWREQTAVEKLRTKIEESLAPSKKRKKKTSTTAKIKEGIAKLTTLPKETTTESERYRSSTTGGIREGEAKVYTRDMETRPVITSTTGMEERRPLSREYTTTTTTGGMEESRPLYTTTTTGERPLSREYAPSTTSTITTGVLEEARPMSRDYTPTTTREYREYEKSPEYKRYAPSLEQAEENVIEREGKVERRVRYRSKEDFGPEIRVLERGEPSPAAESTRVEVIRRLKDRSAELQLVLDKIARAQTMLREAELDYHDQISLASQEESASTKAKERLRELSRLIRERSNECRRLIDEEREYERMRAQKREQAVEVENQRTKLMAEEALLKREIDARLDLANEHRRAAKHSEDLKKAHQLALRELEGAKASLSQSAYDVEVIGERVLPRTRPVEIEVEAIPGQLPELTRIETRQPVGEHRGRVISEELPKRAREKVQVDAAKAEKVREKIEHIVISQ